MLKDAIGELKQWREDEDDQDEGFVGSDDEDGNDSIEDLFNGSRLPAHRKDLQQLLDHSLKKLKLIDMLFQALLKRRIKTFTIEVPSTGGDDERIRRVDELSGKLKAISEGVDELATAFYELNINRAQAYLERITDTALMTAKSMIQNWNGSEDEFSVWTTRWEGAITKRDEDQDKTKVS
jgi:hypothetical protein